MLPPFLYYYFFLFPYMAEAVWLAGVSVEVNSKERMQVLKMREETVNLR